MQRIGTVVVALLAVLALAGAAGSFGAVDQPSLQGGEGPAQPTERTAGAGGSDPGQPDGEESGGQVAGASDETAATADGGGVSPLFVAVFLAALATSAVAIVVLTGDDERAPAPTDDPADGGDPRPTVTPSYGSPGDNAVVRAWQRLSETTEATDTATPGETARRATAQGLPEGTVSRLTDAFQAVRYGNRPVDEDRELTARDALDEIEEEAR